jgi:hypothetical protein
VKLTVKTAAKVTEKLNQSTAFWQIKNEEQQTTKTQIQYRKTFNRFTAKDSGTGNSTQNVERSGGDLLWFRRSTGMKGLWQKEYRDERPVGKGVQEKKKSIANGVLREVKVKVKVKAK